MPPITAIENTNRFCSARTAARRSPAGGARTARRRTRPARPIANVSFTRTALAPNDWAARSFSRIATITGWSCSAYQKKKKKKKKKNLSLSMAAHTHTHVVHARLGADVDGPEQVGPGMAPALPWHPAEVLRVQEGRGHVAIENAKLVMARYKPRWRSVASTTTAVAAPTVAETSSAAPGRGATAMSGAPHPPPLNCEEGDLPERHLSGPAGEDDERDRHDPVDQDGGRLRPLALAVQQVREHEQEAGDHHRGRGADHAHQSRAAARGAPVAPPPRLATMVVSQLADPASAAPLHEQRGDDDEREHRVEQARAVCVVGVGRKRQSPSNT